MTLMSIPFSSCPLRTFSMVAGQRPFHTARACSRGGWTWVCQSMIMNAALYLSRIDTGLFHNVADRHAVFLQEARELLRAVDNRRQPAVGQVSFAKILVVHHVRNLAMHPGDDALRCSGRRNQAEIAARQCV